MNDCDSKTSHLHHDPLICGVKPAVLLFKVDKSGVPSSASTTPLGLLSPCSHTYIGTESSPPLLRNNKEDKEEWQDIGLTSNSPPAPFAQRSFILVWREERHERTLPSNRL